MQSFLGFASYYRNHIRTFAHIASSLYKLCSKDVFFEITKERRDSYERIKAELRDAPMLILPHFVPPFNLYIDAACSQGLGAALHQRKIVDGEPREGVICYISRKLKYSEARLHSLEFFTEHEDYQETHAEIANSHPRVWKQYDHHIQRIQKPHQCRWLLDNVKSNLAYDPEAEANSPIHFMEIDRRNNFRFSEWAADSGDTDSEGTETPILGISSSQLYNEFFSAVMKTYAKHKQHAILLQLLQQNYRTPELECQLEEPWLRDFKDNKDFLIDVLLYHREKHKKCTYSSMQGPYIPDPVVMS
ncbi:hypothetical protein O181_017235 [Austropuccinia psidii MF-1]|uniref:Reverse transcriptase/retrotransposon-derived protein RNase H-like domain-containing protein n=1 Tax=Austropuccinia psidii MF-1 TaxID=1389203 RepID=A0A9Q3GST6_9BASI|nr:hypothetical protein [Austropuccinia psidii MF-1]